MGTWGSGPLDSDTAEDCLEELEDMSPQERKTVIEATFRSVREGGGQPSSAVLPEEVIAAATVVAANTPAGRAISWHKDYPIAEWLPKPLGIDLPAKAMEALEAAVSPEGYYWRGWVNPRDGLEARESIDNILAILRSERSRSAH